MTDNYLNRDNFRLTEEPLKLDYIEEKDERLYPLILNICKEYRIDELGSRIDVDGNKIYTISFKDFNIKIKFIFELTNIYKNKKVLMSEIYDPQIASNNLVYFNNKRVSFYHNKPTLYYLFYNDDINIALFLLKYPETKILS